MTQDCYYIIVVIVAVVARKPFLQMRATGFISIYGLPTKVQAIVNSEKEGE